MRYEIRVAAEPISLLARALGGLEFLPPPPGESRLVGDLADEAALYGALHRLHDLHVDLLELRRLDRG